MNAHRTRIFKSGNSVAVRLPKGFQLEEGMEVEVEQDGDLVTIRRRRLTNKELVEALRTLPKPSYIEERAPIEFPERPGL